MINFIKAELYKIFKSKNLILYISALVFFIVTQYSLLPYEDEKYSAVDSLEHLINPVILSLIGLFTVEIFVADYNTETIKQYLSKGLSRTSIFFCRVLAILSITIFIPFIFILFFIVPVTVNYGFGKLDIDLTLYLIRIFVVIIIMVITYTAVPLLFAVLTKKEGLSITLTCIIIFLFPFAGFMLDFILEKEVSKYWISNILSNFIAPVSIKVEDYITYGGILIGIIITSFGLGCYVYNKQEF